MLVHNICRSTRRFRGGAVGRFFLVRAGICGLGSVRARSVFPCRFGYFLLFLLLLLQIQNKKALLQGKSKRTSKSMRALTVLLDSLARPLSSAKFCGCFRKRSSCADTSLTRSFCQRCWIKS